MQIFVRLVTGESVTLWVKPSSTIDEVKTLLTAEGVDLKGQFIICAGWWLVHVLFTAKRAATDQASDARSLPPPRAIAGKALEEGRTLWDYKIQEYSTFHLMLRLRGGMLHESSGRHGFEELDGVRRRTTG
jgi:hypothetical protein